MNNVRQAFLPVISALPQLNPGVTMARVLCFEACGLCSKKILRALCGLSGKIISQSGSINRGGRGAKWLVIATKFTNDTKSLKQTRVCGFCALWLMIFTGGLVRGTFGSVSTKFREETLSHPGE
jgi:hypothetical protein